MSGRFTVTTISGITQTRGGIAIAFGHQQSGILKLPQPRLEIVLPVLQQALRDQQKLGLLIDDMRDILDVEMVLTVIAASLRYADDEFHPTWVYLEAEPAPFMMDKNLPSYNECEGLLQESRSANTPVCVVVAGDQVLDVLPLQ
jgi:hypothetical protein